LPGRLQERYLTKSRDAGPVNFIGLLGAGYATIFRPTPSADILSSSE
jgi:hypothetical protein